MNTLVGSLATNVHGRSTYVPSTIKISLVSCIWGSERGLSRPATSSEGRAVRRRNCVCESVKESERGGRRWKEYSRCRRRSEGSDIDKKCKLPLWSVLVVVVVVVVVVVFVVVFVVAVAAVVVVPYAVVKMRTDIDTIQQHSCVEQIMHSTICSIMWKNKNILRTCITTRFTFDHTLIYKCFIFVIYFTDEMVWFMVLTQHIMYTCITLASLPGLPIVFFPDPPPRKVLKEGLGTRLAFPLSMQFWSLAIRRNGGGRPGPFYHVNDISEGRQREQG